MELILVRHGIAADRENWSGRDLDRPLTPEGAKRFASAARGLAGLGDPPSEVLASPARRARETAEIAAKAWGLPGVTETPALCGGSFDDLEAVLDAKPRDATLALVGHEPQLSELLAQLVGSGRAEELAFKKGGAARLALPGRLREGGRLLWLLPPRVLRALST